MMRLTRLLVTLGCVTLAWTAMGQELTSSEFTSTSLQEAEAKLETRDYDQAAVLYQQVSTTGATAAERLAGHTGLVLTRLASGRQSEAAEDLADLKRDHPTTPGVGTALCEIGDEYSRQGNYTQALSCYDQVITERKDSEPNAALWSHQGAAMVHLSQGDLSAAETHKQQLLTQFRDEPSSAMAAERLAKLYDQCGHTDQARGLFTESLSLAQQHNDLNMQAWSRQALARMHLKAGQDAAAQSQVTALLEDCHRHPAWVRSLSRLADQCSQEGKPQMTVWLCEQALARYGSRPESVRLWCDLAKGRIALDQHDQAQAAVDEALDRGLPGTSAIDDSIYVKNLFRVAHRWESAERYDLAGPLYQQILNRYPNIYASGPFLSLRVAKCNALAALKNHTGPGRTGRINTSLRALKTHDKGIGGTSSTGTTETSATGQYSKILYQVAIEYRQAGKTTEAQDLYNAIIAHTSQSTSADQSDELMNLQFRALALLALDRVTEAESVMMQVFNDFGHEPLYVEAIYDFGLVYFNRALRRGSPADLSRREVTSQQGEAEQPASADQLALADQRQSEFTRRGGFTAAQRWLSRLVHNCPFDGVFTPQAAYYLSCCTFYLEQYGQARMQLERWITSYPEHPLVSEVMVRLSRCYKRLVQQEMITEAEGEQLQRALYTQLVTDYPDSPGAPMAQDWLETHF